MTALLVAAVAFGLTTSVSGWFVLQARSARASGLGLLLGGALVLLGCAAVQMDVGAVDETLFRLAGCLVLPSAVLAYPRPAWRDPLSFVLIVVAVACGAVCVVWEAAFEPLGFLIVGALLVRTWWAFEHVGDAADRRALSWSSLAWIGSSLVSLTVVFVADSAESTRAFPADAFALWMAAAGPVAMAIGVIRPELIDVRGLVTRAVVAGTVLVAYVAAASGLTSLVEALRGEPLELPPTVMLCAVLAFGVRPMQVLLRGVVDQLLFGDRPDPLRAATNLADRIGDDPVLALDAIREALVLPYASVRSDGEELAVSGVKVTHTRVLPLHLGDDATGATTVGEIEVGLRPGDLNLSAADEQVLRIVAPLLAQTLRARAMSEALQRSREAVVMAVEEERLRLRRDIHDGLGPTLSGVAFATDAARNQLRTDPARAEELLVLLRADTAGAITEIRRLVEGLRPPALDELGLVGAVRQHAASLHSANGVPLIVSVSVPAPLPPLSAAVEVAAYRIVVEALTNVARHADATTADVALAVQSDDLVLSVLDDGSDTDHWSAGVGLHSMRERSEQLGGALAAGPSGRGGSVIARIPLPR